MPISWPYLDRLIRRKKEFHSVVLEDRVYLVQNLMRDNQIPGMVPRNWIQISSINHSGVNNGNKLETSSGSVNPLIFLYQKYFIGVKLNKSEELAPHLKLSQCIALFLKNNVSESVVVIGIDVFVRDLWCNRAGMEKLIQVRW